MDRAHEFLNLFAILADPELPRPVGEHRFHADRRWRFDAAWPDLLVAVEIEGLVRRGPARHQTISGYTADAEKYNAATMLGWRVLRYTNRDLRSRPVQIIDEVSAMLRDAQ